MAHLRQWRAAELPLCDNIRTRREAGRTVLHERARDRRGAVALRGDCEIGPLPPAVERHLTAGQFVIRLETENCLETQQRLPDQSGVLQRQPIIVKNVRVIRL